MTFYLRGFKILCTPQFLYKKNFTHSYDALSLSQQKEIALRVSYYNKLTQAFTLDSKAISIKKFLKDEEKKTYFFDLLEYLKYFNYHFKISYLFGDIITVPKTPTIVKSRPINENNQNSILMKLNKVRHFIFIDDTLSYEEKKDIAVWRGKCYKEHRQAFVKRFYNSPLCNIGQTNTKGDLIVPWQKEKLSLEEQLAYKFLIAIEGNDVASNLKWAMSSNSLVMMAKPKYETWFMEGQLVANHHYVLLNDDYSDLEEKIQYYTAHTNEAKKIISHAQKFVEQFKNPLIEDIVSYRVLEKYFHLSNQNKVLEYA